MVRSFYDETHGMDAFNEENFSGKVLDHLGLVSDKIHELDLVQLIDERLPLSSTRGSKVTMGERVAAMIMNGLGFIDTRLYMFPEFLANKPIKRLFGRDLKAENFNDDSIGRCLDAIADYGVTKLFTELSFTIGAKKNLLGNSAHFDTSTLQLYGEFSESELKKESSAATSEEGEKTDEQPIPRHGYSKSHRHDLKQMVINLATTGKSGFPIWMESHSGNASDKKILPEAVLRMNEFCKKLSDSPDFLYVGDSAMYENILKHSDQMKWLSRVPEKILKAKQLVNRPNSEINWSALSDGYSYYATKSNYGGVDQRWILFFSEHAYKREIATLNKNIKKELDEYEKLWWHLSNEEFSCKEDAQLSIKKLTKKMKYHEVNTHIVEVQGYTKPDRPSKQSKPEMKGYKIQYDLRQNKDKIAEAKERKGRFILSTNQMDCNLIPDSEILAEYKAQSSTEGGFKFIKDDAFELDSIFLKTPSRISALMMVMTLCLMVYGVSQYDLRLALKKAEKTLPNQKRKPTDMPSMKWIYYLFSGVHELTVNIGNMTKTLVINVNELLREIIGYFGGRAKEIYLSSA